MAYVDEINTLTPIAYWRLGEASGTVADDQTTNNYDGTLVGSPTLGETSLQAFDSDTSITFNANDYMSAEYSFGTVKSIAFLVKPGTLTGEDTILSLSDGTDVVKVYIDSSDNNYLKLTDGTTTVATTTALNAGTTYHVVITNDTGDIDIYVNGVSVLDSTEELFNDLTVTKVGIHTYEAAPGYSETVINLAPLHYWRLEETSGTAAVDEMGNQDGVYVNPYFGSGRDGLISDSAYSFFGDFTNRAVRMATALTFSGNNSVALLYKADTISGLNTIFGDGNPGGGNPAQFLLATSSGNWYVTVGNAAGTHYAKVTDQPHPLVAGNTYHIVMTVDGTSVKIYVNGVLDFDQTFTYSTAGLTSQVTNIGRYGDYGDFHIDGLIDEVAYFNSTLTAANVTTLYNATGLGG